MKKYISVLSLFCFLFFFQSCTSQSGLHSQEVDQMINSKEFTFHAQRANTMNYSVINNVMNTIPNATGMRILELNDSTYTIEIKDNLLDVYLPYFGRSFNTTSYGNSDHAGYQFTSKDFSIKKEQNRKGNWIVKIKPNDVRNANEIIMEISKSGKTLTSIRSNDRQPISYDGYISKTKN